MAQIADKSSYHELTDKQQAVVDELADDPTAQNTEIAERAGVSRSTVFNVKEHYAEIIEAQLNRRGRHNGQETTEGDPFDGQLEFTQASQLIGDRPEQPAADGGDTDTAESLVSVSLGERAVRDVLAGGDCEHVRAELIETLVKGVFDDVAS